LNLARVNILCPDPTQRVEGETPAVRSLKVAELNNRNRSISLPLDMAGINRMTYNAWVRVIPLRCLGSMNLVWIADTLSRGIDGVLLLGCQHGDDYQCHFIKGSELADIRLSKVAETLDRLALESERVRFETVSIIDYPNLPKILDDFAAGIDEVGPNPFKGW